MFPKMFPKMFRGFPDDFWGFLREFRRLSEDVPTTIRGVADHFRRCSEDVPTISRRFPKDWVLLGVWDWKPITSGLGRTSRATFEGLWANSVWGTGFYSVWKSKIHHFRFEGFPTISDEFPSVFCVAWSQDPSFYCCPRDCQDDPASGWQPCEEIELFSRRKQEEIDDFYGYF